MSDKLLTWFRERAAITRFEPPVWRQSQQWLVTNRFTSKPPFVPPPARIFGDVVLFVRTQAQGITEYAMHYMGGYMGVRWPTVEERQEYEAWRCQQDA